MLVVTYTADFYIANSLFMDHFLKSVKNLMGREITWDDKVWNEPRACKIPWMDPFDKTVMKYVFKPKPFNCSDIPPLVTSNQTHLIIEWDNIGEYNMTEHTQLNCSYQQFWRVVPKYHQKDHLIEYENQTHFFNASITIDHDYVRVRCFLKGKQIYKDFHSFVPVEGKKTESEDGRLNVIIVGIDAVSRLNFHRTMPKTLNFLVNELQATEFYSFNKIGDNTFPNLVATLTGSFGHELKKTCAPNDSVKFDECDFVWKDYNKSGYVTAFCEESSWMGVFHYGKRGFEIQPTTHYWTTFSFTAESEIGHNQPGNAHLCIGTRPVYTALLDYASKMIHSYQKINQKFFGIFWETSLTHDYLNYPQLADENYLNFLQNLKDSNILKKSVLFMISDHGIRWGDIRSTHQGHMEERLPMLYIVLPKSFHENYPEAAKNIENNAFELTTPFDLHKTLQAIAYNDFSTEAVNDLPRGISLFRPIPRQRTCKTADVLQHWCTCQDDHPVKVTNKTVINIVNFAIKYINHNLENHTNCARLNLSEISDASFSKSFDFLKNNRTVSYYTVIFQTVPGGGVFEATVKCEDCEDEISYELNGSISRTNLYGNQSRCVENARMKLYCYCL